MRSSSTFTSGATLDFARSLDAFVHYRIAFICNRRSTLDRNIKLISNVDIDMRHASAVYHATVGVKIMRIDFAGAVRTDIDRLRRPRDNDRRRAIHIDLKLVVVHALHVDMARAVNGKSVEIRNRDFELHRLGGRVVLRVFESQGVVADFRGYILEHVVVTFNREIPILLTGDFDRERTFRSDGGEWCHLARLYLAFARAFYLSAEVAVTARCKYSKQNQA